MNFMDLYYKNYSANCQKKYWEEPVSLPYVGIRIDEEKERRRFDRFLTEEGFQCVAGEKGAIGVYVNFTLRRFGYIPKPSVTSTILEGTITKEEFMEIYEKYKTDLEFHTVLSHNYAESALCKMTASCRALLDMLEKGNCGYGHWVYNIQYYTEEIHRLGQQYITFSRSTKDE